MNKLRRSNRRIQQVRDKPIKPSMRNIAAGAQYEAQLEAQAQATANQQPGQPHFATGTSETYRYINGAWVLSKPTLLPVIQQSDQSQRYLSPFLL